MIPPTDFVMIGMTTWKDMQRGVSNRNIQMFYELLRREDVGRVLFVDFLPFSWKTRFKTMLYSRTVRSRITEHTITETMDPRIAGKKCFVLTIASRRRIQRDLQNAIQKLKLQSAIGISYHPFYAEQFFNLPLQRHIFDVVDDWRTHPSLLAYKAWLDASYRIIEQRADLILTVSKELQQRFPHHKQVRWLPNGVDLDTVNALRTSTAPDFFNDIPHPIIGYNGVIESRLDVSILRSIAATHSDKSLVLIGPIWDSSIRKALSECSNVFMVGFQSHLETIKAILHYDVAMIPHRISNFTNTMNPMKLYEYLACGVPVVSTPVSGIEEFQDLVAIAREPEDFCRAISDQLAQDSPSLHARRVDAMQQHSYVRRVDTLFSWIQEFHHERDS